MRQIQYYKYSFVFVFHFVFVAVVVQIVLSQLLDPLDLCLLCFVFNTTELDPLSRSCVYYGPSCNSNCTITATICVFLCAFI